ncbi:MAG: hypothetical protein AB7T74_17340 [Clostridia bacterium]
MGRDTIHHIDEARAALFQALKEHWKEFNALKVLVIEDAFGRFTFGVWGKNQNTKAFKNLLASIKPFGADTWFQGTEVAGGFDPMELASSWDEAGSIDTSGEWDDRIRLVVRHRMLPAWQRTVRQPLLRELGRRDCPVVAFYSFKGGMGRSTALALFALDRMRHDEHVVVLDLDIDAPGLGTILPTDTPSSYGIVDYLLELPVFGQRPDDLRDYYYTLDLPGIRSTGSVKVFPAGRLDGSYLGKMARLDFEAVDPADGGLRHPLEELIAQIHQELHPDWILIDSRTGFSETAGMILSGLCDYHVLFGVQSAQSWEGLGYAIKKLGVDRVQRGFPQADLLLVHAMVPEALKEKRDDVLQAFAEKARDVCSDFYYLEPEQKRDEAFWYLDDAGSETSPDHPVALSYRPAFSQAVSVSELLDALDTAPAEIKDFCSTVAQRAESLIPGSFS